MTVEKPVHLLYFGCVRRITFNVTCSVFTLIVLCSCKVSTLWTLQLFCYSPKRGSQVQLQRTIYIPSCIVSRILYWCFLPDMTVISMFFFLFLFIYLTNVWTIYFTLLLVALTCRCKALWALCMIGCSINVHYYLYYLLLILRGFNRASRPNSLTTPDYAHTNFDYIFWHLLNYFFSFVSFNSLRFCQVKQIYLGHTFSMKPFGCISNSLSNARKLSDYYDVLLYCLFFTDALIHYACMYAILYTADCQDGWFGHGSSCYLVVCPWKKVNYNSASSACKAQGAWLATIADATKTEWIKSMWVNIWTCVMFAGVQLYRHCYV